MDTLQTAASALCMRKRGLTIGCTLEISGLVLLPIFSRLKRFLGEEVAARIVVYDYDMLPDRGPNENTARTGSPTCWPSPLTPQRDAP